jgi:hypothetical protein
MIELSLLVLTLFLSGGLWERTIAPLRTIVFNTNVHRMNEQQLDHCVAVG